MTDVGVVSEILNSKRKRNTRQIRILANVSTFRQPCLFNHLERKMISGKTRRKHFLRSETCPRPNVSW
jgi:hypothetical protein